LGSAETHDQNRVLRLFGIETFIEHEPRDLKDHSEYLWVKPEDFSKFPMTPAEYGLLSNLKNILNDEREIIDVSVWSVAKLSAVIHGIFGIFAGAFFLTATMAWTGGLSTPSKVIGALLLPFFNILVGLILGALVALLYNFYATMFGGIKVKVR
jgi:hypothetical protein